MSTLQDLLDARLDEARRGVSGTLSGVLIVPSIEALRAGLYRAELPLVAESLVDFEGVQLFGVPVLVDPTKETVVWRSAPD